MDPVHDFIMSAQSSLLIKQFTFTEPGLMEAAIDRKKAGVDVRIMLNPQRSGGDRANDESYEAFKSAGIDVQWSSPKFYVTHEKSIVVDESAAMVATFNLMIKYFTLTRDYGIITHDPQHVAQIVDVFNADWEHRDFTPPSYEGLLWSTRIPVTTWRVSSTPPSAASTSSTPSTWTRSSSTTSLRPLIAV